MSYQKPAVLSMGYAVNAIQADSKPSVNDTDGIKPTDPAYQSDE